MINVELKGGVVKEFENGISPAEIAKSIGMGQVRMRRKRRRRSVRPPHSA